MKIALLVPEMEMGGVEECVADLAVGLTARGQSVSLLSAGGRLIPSLEAAGVECFSLPLHRKDPCSFLCSATGAERILRRIRPDIIHAHSRVPAWAGHYAARRLPSAHLVTTFHAFYNRHFPSRVMGRGERVIAVSGALADYARRYFGVPERNLRVVYNGVRPIKSGGQIFTFDRPVKGKDLTPVVLGTLGRLTSGKGFELFLDILRKVRVVYPETRGVLGLGVESAEDPAVRHLQYLAAGGDLSGAVKFLFNPRREEFFAAANIYVGCVTEPEGFGRVIIEAQTVGLPVAASRLGAFPELIEDGETGLLAAPEAGAFADAVMRLIRDTSLRERISRAGWARAGERFTVDRMVDDTLKVYEEFEELGKRGQIFTFDRGVKGKDLTPAILIIKTGALGDLVLASAFFQTVRDNFPDSRLYLLTHAQYLGVVEACPLFEEVFALTDQVADDFRTIREIRRRSMDVVLDFQGGLKTNFWALLSGARVRAGVYESILGGLVFSTKARRVPDPKLGPVESQYPLLSKLGLSRFESRLRVWVTAADRAAFPEFTARLGIAAARPRVVIHPGSSAEWPSKRWPDENYTDLAEALAVDHQVVFVGQAADRAWVDSLIGGMKRPAINTAGQTTFAQLYQLLEGAALVVTTDSAPLHLAAAAGVRTIALFGPTDPGRHCPPGPTALFHPGSCGPCYRKQCARHACLRSITVAEVLEAFRNDKNRCHL